LAQDEDLEIDIASSSKGTYYFGTTNQNTKATYTSSFSDVNLSYQTKIVPGPVANITSGMLSGGAGYTSDCVLLSNGQYSCSSSHQTTGGSGSGLTLSLITSSSGIVTSVKVASPGNNYKAGDIITISGGATNATVKVLNVEGSNGEVVITENTGDTISGTFKFNAANSNGNPLGADMVNFQYGTFYKVPIQ
jgi:hypothetical protein